MLEQFLEDFPAAPGRGVECPLFVGVTFNEKLELPEDHLHHHRLRARPSAPQPSEWPR
jgi:hypothetical protein